MSWDPTCREYSSEELRAIFGAFEGGVQVGWGLMQNHCETVCAYRVERMGCQCRKFELGLRGVLCTHEMYGSEAGAGWRWRERFVTAGRLASLLDVPAMLARQWQ